MFTVTINGSDVYGFSVEMRDIRLSDALARAIGAIGHKKPLVEISRAIARMEEAGSLRALSDVESKFIEAALAVVKSFYPGEAA